MDIEFVKARKAHALAGVNLALTFGPVKIQLNDFRLLSKKDGQLWLAPPEFAVPGSRKDWQYTPIVLFDDATREKIESMVVAAWEARGGKV